MTVSGGGRFRARSACRRESAGLVGANPLNADENADSIPDGVPQASWTADPLWPANAPAGAQSISISLNSTIPVGASASLVVGGLCIPLRSPGAWTLALVPGELYPFRLHANGATADLSIAPATNTPPQRSGPPLTLKHDNQTSFSIVHPNSVGETHTNGVIEIRYKNGDGAWWVLGNETDLQPWTARFPGAFEVGGIIASGGGEWTTPVRDLTVQFPSVDDIRFDPDVIQRAELEWVDSLNDCTTNSGLTRERGYWIALDTRTSCYAAMNPTVGDWFSQSENDAFDLSNRPPDLWSDPDNHQAGAIYVVASFHTHPPTATWQPGGEPGRPVGPSEDGDLPTTAALQVPGLVYDYEPDPLFSANWHTNGIPAGWPTNAPARIYPVTPPERRPQP